MSHTHAINGHPVITLNPRERNAGLLARIGSAIRQWAIRQSAERELRALPDHLLADIGIERERIGAIVDDMVTKR